MGMQHPDGTLSKMDAFVETNDEIHTFRFRLSCVVLIRYSMILNRIPVGTCLPKISW